MINSFDNCTLVANEDQRDTDGDDYGNICDGDLNNDEIVDSLDTVMFREALFTTDADADFNGDGVVDSLDTVIFRGMLFLPPGPSGAIEPPPVL